MPIMGVAFIGLLLIYGLQSLPTLFPLTGEVGGAEDSYDAIILAGAQRQLKEMETKKVRALGQAIWAIYDLKYVLAVCEAKEGL